MMAADKNSQTEYLTVAQALIKFLQSQYSVRDGSVQRFIPAIFGIFGHGNVAGMSQALIEYGHELPYYKPCNEQSMVHTASGFAKATNRMQTLACAASIGPGSTNMLTGAALATINRLPVLLLPSDYYATRHQGPVLQQLEHTISSDMSVNDCFRVVSKFFDRISRPEQLLTALPEAMRVLTDPVETGAVTISLPQDVQSHAYHFPKVFFEEKYWHIERRAPRLECIKEAIEMIRTAQRPVIISGGGVHYSGAGEALNEFSHRFGIPVCETFAGKGAIRGNTALLLGGQGLEGTPASSAITRDADLVICVGTRLTDFTTGSHSCFQHPDVKFININITSKDAYKQGALPIIADALIALKELHKAGEEIDLKPNPRYVEEITALINRWKSTLDSALDMNAKQLPMSQGQLIRIMNEEARPGDTIVAAAGSPPGDLLKMWEVGEGKNCHLEFGYSCMGYEIPAGLGVRMANSSGEVFVFIGDGTYLMNPTELVTAVQENLKITLVISVNHGYQVIRRLQMGSVGHSFGNEFKARDSQNRLEGPYLSIDYAKNAESLGAKVWSVSSQDDLRLSLRNAREEAGVCVIVVETQKHKFLPDSEVWWDVAPAEVSSDETTRQLRQRYEEQKQKQRFYYS